MRSRHIKERFELIKKNLTDKSCLGRSLMWRLQESLLCNQGISQQPVPAQGEHKVLGNERTK